MAILKKSEQLNKELGLLSVYALAVGTTLSAGFFLLPGIAASQAGPAVILAYMLAAVPLIPAMLSKVELATAMPRAGGVYYFLDRSMGPMLGTIGGFGTWLALSLKAAFALVGMGAYLNLLFPNMAITPMAIAFALAFGVVNLFGAKGAGTFQLVLVMGLLATLTWFMGGIFHVQPAHFDNFFGAGGENIMATAGLVYVSFVGVTKVISVSEEVKNPERNLPRGVFLAIATALVIYGVGTTVMVGVVPMEVLAKDYTPVATTAQLLVGDWGKYLMIGAALLAFCSVTNASILSASRYPLAMSRDQLLPPVFGKLSPGKGIPVNGVMITVVIIMVILVACDPVKIAKMASVFQLLLFALNCLAVIVMRESHIESYDPGYKSPFYPWLQLIGIASPFIFIYFMGYTSVIFAIGLFAAGMIWFLVYGQKRVHRVGAIFHVFERLGRRRHVELDAELRGIMKEKGLRHDDPFDEIIARARIIDLSDEQKFEPVARQAAALLSDRVPETADQLYEGFVRGTRIGATPVSHGAALPHLRLAGIDQPEMIIVRDRGGVQIDMVDAFGEQTGESNETIQAVFFLVSPVDNPGQHLRLLAQIAGRVDDEGFLKEWQQAGDEQAIKETLLRDERYLSVNLDAKGPGGDLVDKLLRELQFPPGCLIALVRRGDMTFVPGGNTNLRVGDRLTIIGEPEGILELYDRYH